MDVGAVLPTLSQIRNWDTEHLSQAADDWEAEAQRWETTYDRNYQRLADTDWQGQAREAALERAGLDLVKVRGTGWQLREAADAARYGFAQQYGAKELALDAVADAEHAGFSPKEDLSVADRQTGGSAAPRAARLAEAQALAAQIRHRAAKLVASNQEIANKSLPPPATSANSASTSPPVSRPHHQRRKTTEFNSSTIRVGKKTPRHRHPRPGVRLLRAFTLPFRAS